MRGILSDWDLGSVLGALVLLLSAAIAGRLAAWIALRLLARWAKRTATVVDDLVVEHLARPLAWLAPALAVASALRFTPHEGRLLDALDQMTLVSIVVCSGWSVMGGLKVVEALVDSRANGRGPDGIEARAARTKVRGLLNIVRFIIVVVTLAFALMTFEAVRNIGAGLLASAGVAGVVLGFAAQRSIATILAGVQIAIAQPIRVDDAVVVEGEWGNIEEINLTYVVVRLWDLRRLIVPVQYFIEKPFQNWTRAKTDLLGTVELSLDYSTPVDELRKEFERLLAASPLWDMATQSVQVTGASESTMLVRFLMSARNASDAFALRTLVREKMIGFLNAQYPRALPRVRAEIRTEEAQPRCEPSDAGRP